MRSDPAGLLVFVENLPTHEQGLLFAKVQGRPAGCIAVALPSFDKVLVQDLIVGKNEKA